MTNRTLGRWLLVALAIAGLAFAAPAVSAHGDEPVPENGTAVDGVPADGDVADWETRIDGHMTEFPWPDGLDETESHTGVTVGETAQGMSDDAYTTGMNGRGYGC